MNLEEIRGKDVRFGVGLMSGSSCDGVDAALLRIKGSGPEVQAKLGGFETIPYPSGLKIRLLAPRMDAHEVCRLNFELGERFAEAAQQMLAVAAQQECQVDFIASHGHTIAHNPPRDSSSGGTGTLQIAEPAIIAERTGLPVISGFRPRDMAAGGQGAPLVPYADWLLFHREKRTVACLNIGGISNITVVTPEIDGVLAFDTGPGNMVIDGAVRLLTRGVEEMDKDGAIAGKGVIIDEFLEYLLGHHYFDRVPPKSTGREEFGPEVYLRDALASRRDYNLEDLVATVTAAVAFSIIRAHTRFIKPNHNLARVIVSGGGVHNKTLMKHLKRGFTDTVVRTSEDYGINSDAREAIAFALLGNETLCGHPGNVPQATGARHPVILGNITPA